MDFPYGETVTVLTAGTEVDPYSGVSKPSWDVSPTSVAVDGVAVALGGTTEPTQDAQNSVQADFDLFFPTGATVTRFNKVVVRGATCNVVGVPFLWTNPFTGWEAGLVVQAKFEEG